MCRGVLFGRGLVLVFLDGKPGRGSGKGKVPDTGFFERPVFWLVSLDPPGVFTLLPDSHCDDLLRGKHLEEGWEKGPKIIPALFPVITGFPDKLVFESGLFRFFYLGKR